MSTSNHKNSRPVGFFDSGVGGLSVYARFKKLLPCENTVYYGDLAHLPYGNKTKEQLVGYATEILDFYKSIDVKAVVIACNTSSAQAYDIIKDRYDFKIYPIIQSCAKVIANSGAQRIGVFATEATVKAHAYARELLKYNSTLDIKETACPNWVTFVETNKADSAEARSDAEKHLSEMSEFKPDKIILGCTHYPYMLDILSEFIPRETFIDPAEIFVDFIKYDMELNASSEKGSETIYVSACPEKFRENAKIFYDAQNVQLAGSYALS